MGSFSPLPLLSKEDNMVTTQNGDEVSLKPSETFGRFIAETESCTVTVWSVIIRIIIIRVVISVFLFYLWVCCVALSYLFYDLCDEEEQNKKGDQSQLFFLDEWE